MKKFVTLGIVIILVIVGFLLYTNTTKPSMKGEVADTISPSVPISPIFGYLSTWLPTAVWESPKQSDRESFYGKLSGMISEGKIVGRGATIKRNYENADTMKSLGFVEDISLAADGPGASNWGYKKTENGKSQIVIFSYSTGGLREPEVAGSSNEVPTVYLSLFVSDPFAQR